MTSSLSPAATTPAPVRIPMLDLSREFAAIRDEVMAAIEEVCRRQEFVLGPAAARFEGEAAAFCQVPVALGCASGTDALWLALAGLGVGPGDRVITSPFSFYATASSILRAGATPVFADVEERTLNLDPEAVRSVSAASDGRWAKAVLPVHLYGQCAEMDVLASLAQETGALLVEDAAQAFGATWRGIPAGALGDAAAFSFYPTKNLSAFGDAGMVTTLRADAGERMRALRNHGMRQRYLHEEMGGAIGWNSRLDGIQAAVLEIKLRRLPAANERRRALARRYDEGFQRAGVTAQTAQEGVVLPFVDGRGTPIFHQYVIRVRDRNGVRERLQAAGIGTEVYYPLPLHLQPSLAFLGYRAGAFPTAERAANEVLALPMYPELREDEVEEVVATVVGALR